MKKSDSKNCPDQNTLLQFTQGLLEPPKLGQCEQHVSDCPSCHETLRGLDVSDTLSHHVSDAMGVATDDPSDTQAIDGLIQRLLNPENLSLKTAIRSSRSDNSEIMADRAAEVLRCIEPPVSNDNDSLGTLGDYRLLRLIGAGGTGVVFQARDISLDRIVALKVLRPSLGDIARERFIAEARLAASIEHDNVVAIYQIGQQDRLAFIAMQWTPGETLEARLEREPECLDDKTIREFVAQIASGLSAAHERQMIHRDIKPANIWICEDTGRIKILDFGLARVADEESSLTQTGMLAGTPSYMSPEQTRGMELDPRSDLFSLGCVMYRLLTNRLPFSAPTILGTLQTIQSDAPQPPIVVKPDCDRDLSDLTMCLLEKLPANRIESAATLIDCLNSDRSTWPQVVPRVAATTPATSSADSTAKAIKNPQTSGSGSRNWLSLALLIGLLSVPGWFLAPQIFRIVTNQGELVVETTDENIKIQVLKDGELFRVLDPSTNESFDIEAGKYTFNAAGKETESVFEITPNTVTLSRGGREVVSVRMNRTRASSRSTAQADKLADPAEFLSGLMAKKRSIEREFGSARTPAKRKAEFEAAIAGMNVQRDQLLEKLGSGHPTVQAMDRQIASIKTHFEPLLSELLTKKQSIDREFGSAQTPEKTQAEHDVAMAAVKAQRDQLAQRLGSEHPQVLAFDQQMDSVSTHFDALMTREEVPIYGGRTFEQWMVVAKNDREPKTVADAIAACGTLATGKQEDEFITLLRTLVRRYGAAHCNPVQYGSGVPTPTQILFTGFVQAMSQLEPTEIVDFVRTEIESGNGRSLGFCSCMTGYIDYDNDHEKSRELFEKLSFDISPVLQRVIKEELKFNTNARAFLEFAMQNQHAKPSLELAKDFMRKLEVVDRPWIYHLFMKRFNSGEFDEMVEADFFSKSTKGESRQAILHSLSISYGFGGVGGGGLVTFPSPNAELINRLLTKSIAMHCVNLDQKGKGLDFHPWSDFWFDDDGHIKTTKDASGITNWQTGRGGGGGGGFGSSYSHIKPEGASHVEGRTAIVRHLLTRLCQNVAAQKKNKEVGNPKAIASFVSELIHSKKLDNIASRKEIEQLEIEHDLKTLLRLVDGEDASGDFSRFVSETTPPMRGGGGVF